tara:strand:- start:19 stop:138 length:120 start_codon:yes stop_codon:yes gene_type:complete
MRRRRRRRMRWMSMRIGRKTSSYLIFEEGECPWTSAGGL